VVAKLNTATYAAEAFKYSLGAAVSATYRDSEIQAKGQAHHTSRTQCYYICFALLVHRKAHAAHAAESTMEGVHEWTAYTHYRRSQPSLSFQLKTQTAGHHQIFDLIWLQEKLTPWLKAYALMGVCVLPSLSGIFLTRFSKDFIFSISSSGSSGHFLTSSSSQFFLQRLICLVKRFERGNDILGIQLNDPYAH
jgi:hypothetical protein